MRRKCKRRQRAAGAGAAIQWAELKGMHDAVKEVRRAGNHRPGDEAYNLLASLGCCLGNWPRVTARKVEELRRRVDGLLAGLSDTIDRRLDRAIASDGRA